MTSDVPAAPALRIVRGEPDAEDIAALTALLARGGGSEPVRRDARGGWRDPARLMTHMPLPGPSAWRSSGL